MIAKTLMSAAEFMQTGPETDGFELVRGELVPMPPPKRPHGQVCANVTGLLVIYKKTRGAGTVYSNDTGIITETDPDTVRGVDVAFYLKTQEAGDGYMTLPPDLTVEIRSEGQPWKELEPKVDEYLNMGGRMVWIVDPESQSLIVHRPGAEPVTLSVNHSFDGGDTLPGLRFAVRELFE